MERWIKVFENEIPQGKYEILVQNGEKNGLVIQLISKNDKVFLNFGMVSALRMLDEGIALNGLFDDEQIRNFRESGFKNVIYQVAEGEFDKFVQEISGGLYDYLDLKHYVVVSENFIVEIITEDEPDIQVL